MIAVLDYGIGNLRSAQKALGHLGLEASLVRDPDVVVEAAGIVLPGVGAFGASARALRRSGLDEAVRHHVTKATPFLGICVGLQLLFEGSEEDPGEEGLGLLEGVVRALPAGERRPQMQWNVVTPVPARKSAVFCAGSAWYYFVHSYAPVPEGADVSSVAATCDYGGEIVAAVERGPIFGTQFHPEKSARRGLELLGRFAAFCTG
jgi:glutamine amidotransferase